MKVLIFLLLTLLVHHGDSLSCYQVPCYFQNNAYHVGHSIILRNNHPSIIGKNKPCKSLVTSPKLVIRSQTRLDMMLSGETLAAASTIVLSSSIGFASERIKMFKDSGIIITLLIATMASNLNFLGFSAPAIHPLYDLCWSHFLPASLALILFTSSNESIFKPRRRRNNFNKGIEENLSTKEQIIAVGVPFIIGSLGSIIGCLLSATMQVRANSSQRFKAIAMNQVEACIAVGKLL